MPFPTTGSAAELKAVNEILASVGQAPVTTLDQTNPDVAIAYNTLQEVSREVQAEGWTFNKEYCLPWNPDSNKHINIPNNVLQVDLSEYWAYGNKDAVRRDGRLYERNAHTFEWEDQIVYVDVVYLFDWLDLPPAVQHYIVARASTIMSQRVIGDNTLYQMLQQREGMCRAEALEYECNQGDYTFFGHPQGQNYYTSYQPYHALYR